MDIPRNGNSVLLSSAVRAAANVSLDQINRFGKGLILFLNITAVPGTDTITLTIQGRSPLPASPAAGTYYTILAGAAQVGAGLIIMRVYPGLTAVGNLTATDVLPYTWRVSVAHSAASNFTYSVSANIIT